MKYILLLTVLLCAGCEVYQYEIVGYAKNCKDHGGIVKINAFRQVAQCSDGTWAEWYE